jgi:rifampicin phosphotransferase
MTRSPRFTQELSECRNTLLVGGKAVNLGRLLRAGFPVPDGFAVTTRAWQERDGQDGTGAASTLSAESTRSMLSMPAPVVEEIRSAYRTLGSPVVAVRSSATAEDMALASMAGQYETFLDIQGEPALLDAIQRCWASLNTSRVQAYLREHAVDSARVAMAVVVQRLVPADVAGVLFTTSPHDGHRREMLLEASWGLGEMVVSGRVQPDVLRLEQGTGRVLEAAIADKQVYLAVGTSESSAVEESRRRQSCLRGRDVYRLWQLGKRVAEHFGCPQDIEWALGGGELYLLQSRPITTLGDIEAYDEILRTTQSHLRQEAMAGRGPWVLHNLAETLPHPTPLTWSIMTRFMSGSGGFGAMYRQAGFEPSPVVNRDGFLECIAGRIYMDAARVPEMLFEGFPFAYDLEELKRNPDASQSPPTQPRGSWGTRRKAGRRLTVVTAKLRALAAPLERDLREGLFQEIAAGAARAKAIDLGPLSADQLLRLWQDHESLTLDTFGPHLLMPGLIAAMAMGNLRTFLQETLWDEDADALAQLLSAGGVPDRTVVANAELHEVGKGNRPLETWLTEHGHRTAGEFDLAAPRWRERPTAVRHMADRLAAGEGPLERQRRNAEAVNQQLASLRGRFRGAQRRELDRFVSLVRRYITLREDSKDSLMLGYDLLRDLALEAGRRLEVGPDVFYLTRDELFEALHVGFAPYHLIELRKTAHRAESRLTLPRVIDVEAIDTLGEMQGAKPSADGYKALAVSSGQAQGPARILHSPTEAGDLGQGYILVCPSTDPSWTPLFVNAAGLVLECGGTLSHGAVVAREMGLPAVVLPGATKLFCEGQEIHVDGCRGWVDSTPSPGSLTLAMPPAEKRGHSTFSAGPGASVAEQAEHGKVECPLFCDGEGDDTFVPRDLIPPPVGRKDRKAARVSRGLAVVWTLYLIGFFVLPQRYVHQPTLRALDVVLWPVVRSLGKPAVVAVVAVGVALLTLLIQKLATDNRRLREAKRRATVLKRQAQSLPTDSPKRATLMRLAAPVQVRTLIAALVPVGILLGPMVLPFVWFRERVDPAAWNAPAGSAVQIVATVDSGWREPVRIEVPSAVALDDSTPPSRVLPPLRETLEHLLVLYRQSRDDPSLPWELTVAPDLGRQQTANDLQAYLDAGIRSQGITWQIRPPEGMGGRFSVAVTAGEHPPVSVPVVLGDEVPPGPCRVVGPAGSPVQELRVVYPKSKLEPVFWRPPAFLGGPVASIDLGWLWLYILVYLPALVIVRAVLKVA